MADLLSLSVNPLLTWKNSDLPLSIMWLLWLLGNIFFNFGTNKHFFANFKQSSSRLSFSDCSFKTFRVDPAAVEAESELPVVNPAEVEAESELTSVDPVAVETESEYSSVNSA